MKSRKSLIQQEFLKNPALGVILRCNSCLGHGIKQRGFADVGQSNDSALQTHENSLENKPLCTIEPNVGIVEVPDRADGKTGQQKCKPSTDTTIFRGFCPRFA
jgi:hypothetical protein